MRFPTLSTYSSTYLLFLDKLVQRSHEPLFCSLWVSVAVENHAYIRLGHAKFFGDLCHGNSVVVHLADHVASPLCRHLNFPPSLYIVLQKFTQSVIISLRGKMNHGTLSARFVLRLLLMFSL